MNKNKWIFQQHDNDCGIAALAMMFDHPYSDMHWLVTTQARCAGEPFDGTYGKYAKRIGAFLGHTVRLQSVHPENRESITSALRGHPAILVVPANDGSQDYHAVYWDGKTLFDPSPSCRYGMRGQKAFKVFTEAWIPNFKRTL